MEYNKDERLRAIAVLHMVAYTSEGAADKIGAELLFALGEILEGVSLVNLSLTHINRAEFLKELSNYVRTPTGSMDFRAARRGKSSKRLSAGPEIKEHLDGDPAEPTVPDDAGELSNGAAQQDGDYWAVGCALSEDQRIAS